MYSVHQDNELHIDTSTHFGHVGPQQYIGHKVENTV